MPQASTFRLRDSLPQELLARWQEELANLPDAAQTRERRKRIEAALDAGHGACALHRPSIAAMVEAALLHFDGDRYRLHAWVVMPNHVHVLMTPLHGNSLSSILHSWKSYTAKEANRLLGTEGAFWQQEYFDRAIRDDAHFGNAVRYIEGNPVTAGLCARVEDWRFGSAHRRAAFEGREAFEGRAGRPRSQDDIPLRDGGTGATA